MDLSSLEDSDLSDSEIEEHEKNTYEELKHGKPNIKLTNKTFICPYCPNKKTDGYQYKELLQHSTMVGKSDTKKRCKRDKANHLALAKYLEKDISKSSDPLQPKNDFKHPAVHDHDEMFVWPWKGVIVNLPVQLINGRYVGKSGSSMRDELTSRGFNPTNVHPLWDFCSHSAAAVVEFRNDWIGFNNAMSFEKANKADHRGKKDWGRENDPKFGIYGWVARADDYRSNTIIGELLRKNAEIKTVSDIIAQEHLKSIKYISSLTSVSEIEAKVIINKLIAENNKLHQSFDAEMKKMQAVKLENAKLKSELECQSSKMHSVTKENEKLKEEMRHQRKDLEKKADELEKKANQLEKRANELEERESKCDNVLVKKLSEKEEELQNMDILNRTLILREDTSNNELQDAQKELINVWFYPKLSNMNPETQKPEIELQKCMVLKGNESKRLALEIEENATRNNLLEIASDEQRKADESVKKLAADHKITYDELQDARKQLINDFRDLPKAGDIGVKRMGELENKPFYDAIKHRFNESVAEDKASEVCSFWNQYLRDPNWKPFKLIVINGKTEEVIDENDGKLRILKILLGDEAYEAVTTALKEMNEYDPSGRYVTEELWNFTEARKATLREGISRLIKTRNAQKSILGNIRDILIELG